MRTALASALATCGAYAVAAACVAALGADREHSAVTAVVVGGLGCGAVVLGTLGRRAGAWAAVAAAAGAASGAAATAHFVSSPEVLRGRVPLLASAVESLLAGVGDGRGGVVLKTGSFVLHVLPTWGALALGFWSAFLAALAGLRLAGRVDSGDAVPLRASDVLLAAAGATVAYVASVAFCLLDEDRHLGNAAGFRPVGDALVAAAAGAWVPFVIAWTRGAREEHRAPAAPPRSWRPGTSFAAAAAAAAAAGLLALGRDLWVEDGLPGRLRIVVDDAHSGTWERADRRFDLETFGDTAQYNYGAAAEWLAREHEIHLHAEGPIGPETLANAHVLVLKTPSAAFSAGEIAAIGAWVERGGGLVLLGDHTNLFGMNEKLNSLLEGTGIAFDDDSVNDATGVLAVLEPGWRTARGPWLGLGRTQFLTSCSLRVGGRAEGLVQLPHALCDDADYGRDSYFGDLRPDGDEFVGPVWVVARARRGRGRIVCFADSTLFSNFTLAEPGHDRALQAALVSAVGVPVRRSALAVGALASIVAFAGFVACRRLARADGASRAASETGAGLLVGTGAALLLLPWVAAHEARARVPTLVRTTSPRMFVPARDAAFVLLPAIGSRQPELEGVSASTLFTVALRAGVVPSVLHEDEQVPEFRKGDSVLLLVPPPVGASIDRLVALAARARAADAAVYVVAPFQDSGDPRYARLLASLRGPAAPAVAPAGSPVWDVSGARTAWVWAWEATNDLALGHCFDVPTPEALATMQAVAGSLDGHGR